MVDSEIQDSGFELMSTLVKRCSEVESFTIFENYVYRSEKKILCLK